MKNKGFSLLELVVVLIIISLSAALAVPSLSHLSRSMELKTVAKRVSAILRYGRSEAVSKVKEGRTMAEIRNRYDALVIGGGIAGIQAALDIADAGHEVLLV